MYCLYYQAHAKRETCWFVSGVLRNEDHWVFDRMLDAKHDIMEFFVAPAYEEAFRARMDYFIHRGYIDSLQALPNRAELLLPHEQL